MQREVDGGTCRLALRAGNARGAPRSHDGRHLGAPPGSLGSPCQQESCDEVGGRPVHTPKQLREQQQAQRQMVLLLSPWEPDEFPPSFP